MTYSASSHQGFSLVETLVAVTILLVLIVGPMALTVRSTQSATYATQQATAYFLAQEGAELAQKARDDLLLDYLDGGPDDPWGDFVDPVGTFDSCIAPYSGSPEGCGLTVADDADGTVQVVDCVGNGCRLYRNDGSADARSRFVHDPTGAAETPYTRVITLEPSGGREAKVTSEVTWRTGTLQDEQSVRVETYLFNVFDI